MSQHSEIVKEFIVESNENLDRLDGELVALESDPGNKEILNSIFRIAHTIKGTCGFLEFKKLESITHVGETLLDGLSAGRINLDQNRTTALLKLFDATRKIISQIENNGTEGETDYSPLVELLASLSNSEPKKEEAPVASASPASIPRVEERSTPAYLSLPIVAKTAPKRAPTDASSSKTSAHSSRLAGSTLRVDVKLLDQLVNLVGELVLARNQILQFTKTQNDSAFASTSQRLNIITSELQESVMRTRVQPIANVWNRFPRVVRDLARMCGKEINLELEGEKTELDKTILEAIKDPLIHLVRNSVDHGIETPEVREKNGKRRQGNLVLRAYHESGHVIIEITDNGAGLNTERIRSKAIEKGLIAADEAEKMSELEINRLIFAAGFSTAEKITKFSGRGVGLDVVKSNIERIGGSVDVVSQRGNGTTVTIKIPLALATIRPG